MGDEVVWDMRSLYFSKQTGAVNQLLAKAIYELGSK